MRGVVTVAVSMSHLSNCVTNSRGHSMINAKTMCLVDLSFLSNTSPPLGHNNMAKHGPQCAPCHSRTQYFTSKWLAFYSFGDIRTTGHLVCWAVLHPFHPAMTNESFKLGSDESQVAWQVCLKKNVFSPNSKIARLYFASIEASYELSAWSKMQILTKIMCF